MILVLTSLPVHSLTLVVYVPVVMRDVYCIYVCESLKLESGTMMVMVPRQYFQPSNCEIPAMQLRLRDT